MAFKITCFTEHSTISGMVYAPSKAQALELADKSWGIGNTNGLWIVN